MSSSPKRPFMQDQELVNAARDGSPAAIGDLLQSCRAYLLAVSESELSADPEVAAGLENVVGTLQKLGADIRDVHLPTLGEFGAVNRVILCRVLGLPLERVWKFRQAPAALNVLSGPSLAELQVVRLNDSEHSTPFIDDAQHRAL